MKSAPGRVVSSLAIFAVVASTIFATTPACSSGEASSEGVGNPCVPTVESDPTFSAFDEKEVNLETGSPSCGTGICLINHFRGRVSCRYGQGPDGSVPPGASPCIAPGKNTQVTGGTDPRRKAAVPPQCVDRTADKTVYCSCRCANVQARTDDGASYCACPGGFECTQLVTSIGASGNDIAGSYCVKSGTVFDKNTACNQGDCNPASQSCG